MNTIKATQSPNFINRIVFVFVGFCIAVLMLTSVADAQIDGFTEPFRKIELSSDETGSIAVLDVEEGDEVQADQVVAKLDTRVQELQLEIATQQANQTSQMTAAEQAYQKRQAIAGRLNQLLSLIHI